MKRSALLFAFLLCSQFAFSQWTTGFGGSIYYNGGNVGIGITPLFKLHVNGNTLITTKLGIGYVGSGLLTLRSSGGSEMGITQGQVGGTATMELTTKDGGSGQATRLLLRGNNNDADIEFYTGARGQESQTMIINGINGNVGIGTNKTNDGYKLNVNGKIRAHEVHVYTGWADYVFDPEYQLPALSEVEQDIINTGHLKSFPSQEEIESAGGMDIGHMTTVQQEKIEELFLYVIQLDKELREQKEINQNLVDLIQSLKD